MRRYILIISLLVLQPTRIFPVTIEIGLGAPGLYTDANLGPISFSNLNGTPVNGSVLSLDFLFTGDQFVRLFSNT
jgi:hypothetical protein